MVAAALNSVAPETKLEETGKEVEAAGVVSKSAELLIVLPLPAGELASVILGAGLLFEFPQPERAARRAAGTKKKAASL